MYDLLDFLDYINDINTMLVTAINGSPRGHLGNTHIMIKAFLGGIETEGGETDSVLLSRLNIKACTGCFSCWKQTPGQCIIQDDMAQLLTKFSNSDTVILASPIHMNNISSLLNRFIERLNPLFEPKIVRDENGFSRRKLRKESPKLIIMSNSGFTEWEQFEVLQHYFKRLALTLNTRITAEIYRPAGEILRHKMLLLRPPIAIYRRRLKKAGREYAKQLSIPDEFMERVNRNIIPNSIYESIAARLWSLDMNE